MTCNINRTTKFDWFFWLFGIDLNVHDWTEYNRIWEEKIVFECRTCDCGQVEIKQNGPMGDGSWIDESVLDWPDWNLTRYHSSIRK